MKDGQWLWVTLQALCEKVCQLPTPLIQSESKATVPTMDYKHTQSIYNKIHFSYFNRRHPVVFLILKIKLFYFECISHISVVTQMLEMATHMLVEMHVHVWSVFKGT